MLSAPDTKARLRPSGPTSTPQDAFEMANHNPARRRRARPTPLPALQEAPRWRAGRPRARSRTPTTRATCPRPTTTAGPGSLGGTGHPQLTVAPPHRERPAHRLLDRPDPPRGQRRGIEQPQSLGLGQPHAVLVYEDAATVPALGRVSGTDPAAHRMALRHQPSGLQRNRLDGAQPMAEADLVAVEPGDIGRSARDRHPLWDQPAVRARLPDRLSHRVVVEPSAQPSRAGPRPRRCNPPPAAGR